jgi:AraC-like DNA-binding protein
MSEAERRNRVRYWRDRGLNGLSLLEADFTDYEYRPHIHNEWVIAVTQRGGAKVRAGKTADEAAPRAVLCFNPEEPQSASTARGGGWRYRSFYLDPRAMRQITNECGLPEAPHFQQLVVSDTAIATSFSQLHLLLRSEPDAVAARDLMVETFGRLFCEFARSRSKLEHCPADGTKVRKAMRLMREQLSEPLRTDAVAQALRLSPFQLIRLFRRTTGLPPHAYLTQLRLQEARRQLRRGVAIADAAAATGFYDQSALTNHFKACYGLTPAQFAKAARM